MISVAKQRAISLGLQNVIEFKEGDIETIELPSSTFDAVLCRWGLMFLPDLKAGLSNIHRSLKPSGHFAAAVWASPDQATLSVIFFDHQVFCMDEHIQSFNFFLVFP